MIEVLLEAPLAHVRSARKLLVVTLPVFIVLGARHTRPGGEHAWRDGWRPRIVRDVQASTTHFAVGAIDCRAGNAGAGLPLARRVVYVEREDVTGAPEASNDHRQQRYLVVPIGGAESFSGGDPVYVNVDDCKRALVHR